MIDIALKFLRDYINLQITDPSNLAVLGNIAKETDIVNDKIHISLIQVEEEKVLKDINFKRRLHPADDFYTTINPEIRLNLYILITYQYTNKNYEEALKQLSNVVTIFQGKYVFTKPDFMKAAYEPLEQIVLDLYTQTIDQNSNLWQALGEKLSPSLLYKMRVVGIQANKALGTTEEIRAIGIDMTNKPFIDQ